MGERREREERKKIHVLLMGPYLIHITHSGLLLVVVSTPLVHILPTSLGITPSNMNENFFVRSPMKAFLILLEERERE